MRAPACAARVPAPPAMVPEARSARERQLPLGRGAAGGRSREGWGWVRPIAFLLFPSQGATAVAGAGITQSICLPLLSVYQLSSNGTVQVRAVTHGGLGWRRTAGAVEKPPCLWSFTRPGNERLV